MILALPLIRLLVPVWPVAVEERLDEQGRPLLSLIERQRGDSEPRAEPLSAAVLDLSRGGRMIGYVVGLRDAAGASQRPPDAVLWWPGLELPDCSLGVTVERSLDWRPCGLVLRVHHPNRMTTLERLQVALDRLALPRRQTEI